MNKRRKRFMAEEKVPIRRRHLPEQVPASKTCAEHGLTSDRLLRFRKERYPNGWAEGDPRPPGWEVGNSEAATAGSAPAGRMRAKVVDSPQPADSR